MNTNQQISDYIYYYPDAMDRDTCNKIINHFDKEAEWKQSTFSAATVNTGSSKVSMEEYWIGSPLPYYKDIEKTFKFCVDDYIHFHDNIKSTEYTDFRINRYGEGGFMKSHIDNIHHSHGQTFGYPQATVLLFLNENFEGGEFLVSEEQPTIKTGEALIFPSNFMFPHEVKKITKGTRWSIVSWLM